ncbi:hypothetical protein [Francisella tularensis]|nr:hypothetical protein [Francisella tularensis]ADA79286.1 hypothetical protein NE061598_09205 [Francisella tularensis subsp. tularensis NE061598]AKE20835.1 putative membrane protein [Francisella tularensis subsp. tularensis str. SCHU S4 substr. NR-28534]EKM85158.1 hypothetical protein B343_09359 [Francisella tularensis subsp. tularensis 80700075]EOA41047.1 hypothetical protein H647_09409 [Francisella tularensis subsp. tularensis 80700069]EOA41210.1 hypothetical protein H646_09394 [Francisella
MKKCCKLLVIAGLLMSLNSCIWLAVAGIGACWRSYWRLYG